MAEERTITTVFKADISNFSASTQELNRYVSQVNSEFKNATASMGKWNDNADGLRAKLEQLNKVHDAESKKLKSLEAQYEEVVKTQGANSKAAQKLATDINNQSAKVKEAEKNIDYYTDSLKELEDAGVSTKEELDKLNKKLEEQKQAAKVLGSGIAKGAAAGIAGIGAACAGAFAGLNSIVEETKELRTQLGQLEAAFTSAGLSVEASEKTFDDLYAVLGDSGKATEASLQLAKLAKTEKELTSYTDILTGVYATFGDSLPVEGLAEAMNHTAKLGSVQGNLADALEWSGINVDDFNAELEALTTEEERAAHINKTLNNLYGKSAKEYKKVNAEVIKANKAQNEYNKAMADIGAKAQPAITSFKTAMVGVLQTVLKKFDEVNIEGLIGKISGAITSLVNTALPPLMTALTWVLDNANWLVPVLGSLVGVIGGITAGVKIYNGVMQVAKVVQLAWNAVMAANPIGLVITAVAALVAGFVLLWNKCEGFRNFWIGLWEIIKSAASAVADWFVKAWTDITSWFTQAWADVATFFTDLWNGIVTGVQSAWNFVAGIFSKVASWIYDNVIAPVAKFFTDLWNSIVKAYHTVIDPWIEIFKRLSVIVNEEVIQPIKRFFVELWNDIVTGLQTAWNWVTGLCSTVASWIYDNVIAPVAQFFTKLWNGISTAAVKTWEAIKNAFVKAAEWFNNTIIKPVANVFSTMWNGLTNGAKAAWEGIKSVFSKVADFFGNVFSAAWKKVKDVFSVGGKIFDGIKDGIVTAFKAVVNALITGINKVVAVPFNAINAVLKKLKSIEILDIKPFNWIKTFDIPKIPKLAKGGIVDRATIAMVGEAGKEVVMPLENNTAWIDKLADKLNGKGGNKTTNNTVNNYFEKMETSRHALHRANLETRRILKGV